MTPQEFLECEGYRRCDTREAIRNAAFLDAELIAIRYGERTDNRDMKLAAREIANQLRGQLSYSK